MKKILPWVFLLSIFIFLIAWGAMGIKLADGAYEIEAFAYIVLSSMVVMFGFILYKAFFRKKCPHCGKIKQTDGKFCPYCGKEIES